MMRSVRSAFRLTFIHFPPNSIPRHYLSTASIEANNAFLLTLLVCPLSKEPLEYDIERNRLISHTANVAFPVSKEGCINMTIFDAYVMGHEGPDAPVIEK